MILQNTKETLVNTGNTNQARSFHIHKSHSLNARESTHYLIYLLGPEMFKHISGIVSIQGQNIEYFLDTHVVEVTKIRVPGDLMLNVFRI